MPAPAASTPEGRAALDAIVRRAGGVLAMHGGRPTVLRYGSAAGELSACVSAVGVADRSHLTTLAVGGPVRALSEAVRRVSELDPAPGGMVAAEAAWWCRISAGRLIVVGEAKACARLRSRVLDAAPVRVEDVSSETAAVAVAGARARELLAELGVYGPERDPRRAAPVQARRVADAEVLWLLESDRRALALVAEPAAARLWRAVMAAGARLDACPVGEEALARYALIDSGRAGSALPAAPAP